MKADLHVFSAVYEGRPTPRAEDAANVHGASIVCWVTAASKAEAAERARRSIEERLWVVVAVEEPWSQVTESAVTPESLGYFEQAKSDGECYVFHTWDNSAKDNESAH